MYKILAIKKEYLLVLALLTMITICYEGAFKRTIEAWQIHEQIKMQILQSINIEDQPSYFIRKNKNLNEIIEQYTVDSTSFRNDIINTVSLIADKEKVKVSNVPPHDLLYSTDKIIIQKLSLQGDYFSLIKMLNQFYQTKKIGMIRSTSLSAGTLFSHDVNPNKLTLDIYLATVK